MIIETNISQLFETISYTGIFLWFVLYNFLFFLPLPPPELVFITIGYLASIGDANIFVMALIILITKILVDNTFFLISTKEGKAVQKITSMFGKNTFKKYQEQMIKNISKTFIILVFIPKVRLLGPVVSGSIKIKWRQFFVNNLLANATFIASYLFLGFFFHQFITETLQILKTWVSIVMYPVILIIGLLLAELIRKYLSYKK